jgi:hypothetical protein
MRWEERLLDLFDDLEQQAEGLALAGRDAEVAEQSRGEYARVDLAARLHASVGAAVRCEVCGVGRVDARLVSAGDGWCLLGSAAVEWLVRVPAIVTVRGLAHQGRGVEARPVAARLGWGSALRGVAETRSTVVVQYLNGGSASGLLGRVGADFVELSVGDPPGADGPPTVVPFTAIAAVRSWGV